MRLFRRQRRWVDPIGWDEKAQRVHDVGLILDGRLIHYSTCWCRGVVTASRTDSRSAATSMATSAPAIPCEWCGRAIRQDEDGRWQAVKGVERGYDPLRCDASDDGKHNPGDAHA